MKNVSVAIRVIFSSLMLVPLIVLVYFIVHALERPDCISLYLKNKPSVSVKEISWPERGLLTVWFDSTFFNENSAEIVNLMNQYQFTGVISLENDKSCRIQSLSIHQLIQLQNQGWEISEKKILNAQQGEHKINDMPSPDINQLVIYDMSSDTDDSKLQQTLKETKVRNGWIILYFHGAFGSDFEKPMSIVHLKHILKIVKATGIPVVLEEQVLRVSQ